jgi:hypothetical protein
VMVLSALAPTVAQAMVAASGKGQWIEVCSASGMVWLKTGGADLTGSAAPDQDTPMADMGKHCPWCSFHGSAAGLPPPIVSAPVFAPAAQAVPEPAVIELSGKARRSVQARAPPPAS